MSQKDDPEKLMKEAEKAMRKRLFAKPDYVHAAACYTTAAKAYVLAGDYVKGREAYLGAAEAGKKAEVELTVAVSYREAANCIDRLIRLGNTTFKENDIGLLHKQCGEFMQLTGRDVDAARSYLTACRYLESQKECKQLFERALGLFEHNSKPLQALSAIMDLIDTAVEDDTQAGQSLAIVRQAREMYRKQGKYGYKLDTLALLGVILSLHLGDIVGAEQELLQFDSFKDAAEMAEDLLNAYKAHDAEKFAEAKKHATGRMSLTNPMLLSLRRLQLKGVAGGEGCEELL
ncbi:Alpha-snap [Giardia muris]|uniref:Alpha-snap n=1 Tax=Giardia muris TaxID=5742 RepID=A0A4Z1SPU1_GIAMU|nr:Alpha-snap [Giardia muris]|eukprot:TNJ26895.1 Alpha-snap [Giardia muris]